MKVVYLLPVIACLVAGLSACEGPLKAQSNAGSNAASAACQTVASSGGGGGGACSGAREIDWNGPAYFRGSDGAN